MVYAKFSLSLILIDNNLTAFCFLSNLSLYVISKTFSICLLFSVSNIVLSVYNSLIVYSLSVIFTFVISKLPSILSSWINKIFFVVVVFVLIGIILFSVNAINSRIKSNIYVLISSSCNFLFVVFCF